MDYPPSSLLLHVGAEMALPVKSEHCSPPRRLHRDRRDIDQIERHGVRRRPVRPVASGDAEADLRGRRPLPHGVTPGRRDLLHVAPVPGAAHTGLPTALLGRLALNENATLLQGERDDDPVQA